MLAARVGLSEVGGRVVMRVILIAALCISTIAARADAGNDAQIVIDWNERAYDCAMAEDQFASFKGHRALAMMHLAQHDALNDIERRFERYIGEKRRGSVLKPNASGAAAAAQAAHDVLLSQYPQDQQRSDALLAGQLARIADGTAKETGRDLGRRAAASILAARTGDGIDTAGTYTFATGAGTYQTTPDWKGFVAWPALGVAKPFALRSGNQFRPAPPPPLASAEYASAFEEVKRSGALDSTVRTADQTAYAVWWMEFAEGSVNRLARKLAADAQLDLWDAARMFALLNTSLIDSYIAVWDAKFHFNHWRPYTAIRAAQDDGNPRTAPDAQWQPLRPAPPFPDHVSAHAAGCASSFRVLEEFFPGTGTFTMDSKTAPPGMPTRTFPTFRAAARECGDSRVRIGFHFRYATDAGERLGRAIAEHVISERLQGVARRK
jgi:hypothetical protein